MDDPFSVLIAWCRPMSEKASHYELYGKILAESHAEQWLRDLYNTETNSLEPSRRDHAHYLFMAAVRWLCAHEDWEEQRIYMSPTQQARCALQTWSPLWFHNFCLSRWKDIWEIVRKRTVQISKLGRNALLAPLLAHIATIDDSEMAFIDIGASFGFGLLWPYLEFDYGGGNRLIGPLVSNRPPVLKCECNDFTFAGLGRALPNPAKTLGIEIDPISYSCRDDVLWGASLVGPDDADGFDNFERGLSLLSHAQPEIVRGCALKHLPAVIRRQSETQVLVVNHAMFEHHLKLNDKLDEWLLLLTGVSHSRPFFETGIEWVNEESARRPKPVEVFLKHWDKGKNTTLSHGHADASASGTQLKFDKIVS